MTEREVLAEYRKHRVMLLREISGLDVWMASGIVLTEGCPYSPVFPRHAEFAPEKSKGNCNTQAWHVRVQDHLRMMTYWTEELGRIRSML